MIDGTKLWRVSEKETGCEGEKRRFAVPDGPRVAGWRGGYVDRGRSAVKCLMGHTRSSCEPLVPVLTGVLRGYQVRGSANDVEWLVKQVRSREKQNSMVLSYARDAGRLQTVPDEFRLPTEGGLSTLREIEHGDLTVRHHTAHTARERAKGRRLFARHQATETSGDRPSTAPASSDETPPGEGEMSQTGTTGPGRRV